MSINNKDNYKYDKDIKKEYIKIDNEEDKKTTKKNKNKIEKRKIGIKNNIIRKMSIFLNGNLNLNKLKGHFYFNLHNYFLFIIGFITLFTTSINILIVILIVVSLDAISVVMLHECPLTTMERKYLGFTSCDIRNDILKEVGIVYKCDHNYEKQIELLINVWCFITAKCLSIVFFNMFNIKLFDKSNIYINT